MNRTSERYGKYLGSSCEIKNKYIPAGTSWKEYYFWLSGLLGGPLEIANTIAGQHNRGDLLILLREFPDKTVPGRRQIVFITKNLEGFLSQANFGLSNPSDIYSLPLTQYISAKHTGVTYISILKDLFKIYAKHNYPTVKSGMPRQYFNVTTLMKTWLGKSINDLTIRGELNPNRFKSFLPIIMANIIPQNDLKGKHLKVLDDLHLRERLDAEATLYHAILSQTLRRLGTQLGFRADDTGIDLQRFEPGRVPEPPLPVEGGGFGGAGGGGFGAAFEAAAPVAGGGFGAGGAPVAGAPVGGGGFGAGGGAGNQFWG